MSRVTIFTCVQEARTGPLRVLWENFKDNEDIYFPNRNELDALEIVDQGSYLVLVFYLLFHLCCHDIYRPRERVGKGFYTCLSVCLSLCVSLLTY